MALLLLNKAISQTDMSRGDFGFYCMLKAHKLFSVVFILFLHCIFFILCIYTN